MFGLNQRRCVVGGRSFSSQNSLNRHPQTRDFQRRRKNRTLVVLHADWNETSSTASQLSSALALHKLLTLLLVHYGYRVVPCSKQSCGYA